MKKWFPGLVVVAILLAVLIAAPLVQAADLGRSPTGAETTVFLRIDGVNKADSIEGECKVKGYDKQIEVLAIDYGLASSTAAAHAGAGGSAKADFADVTFTKYLDAASPKLFQGCASGKHYRSATFSFVRLGEGKNVPHMVLTLEDVLITSFSQSFAVGDERVQDTVSLNYSKIKMEYTPFNESGTASGTIKGGWDLQGNKPY